MSPFKEVNLLMITGKILSGAACLSPESNSRAWPLLDPKTHGESISSCVFGGQKCSKCTWSSSMCVHVCTGWAHVHGGRRGRVPLGVCQLGGQIPDSIDRHLE